MNINSKRFRKFRGTEVGALIMASAMTLTSPSVLAFIVDSGPVSIPIPATSSGIYLNFLTGNSGTSGGAVSGYDFNPYAADGGAHLGIYWGPSAHRGGGVADPGATPQLAILPPGTTVSSASTFTAAILATIPNLTAGVNNEFIGVKFYNEGTGAFNYGWVQMTTTAPSGFPATIVSYGYDTTGAAVTIPLSYLIFADGFEQLPSG